MGMLLNRHDRTPGPEPHVAEVPKRDDASLGAQVRAFFAGETDERIMSALSGYADSMLQARAAIEDVEQRARKAEESYAACSVSREELLAGLELDKQAKDELAKLAADAREEVARLEAKLAALPVAPPATEPASVADAAAVPVVPEVIAPVPVAPAKPKNGK